MQTKKIYRIEGPDGKGPYNSNAREVVKLREIMGRMHSRGNRPAKFLDFSREVSLDSNYYMACTTRTQLKRWFGKYLNPLIESGSFHVFEYTVPKETIVLGYSKMQCAFDIIEVREKVEISL